MQEVPEQPEDRSLASLRGRFGGLEELLGDRLGRRLERWVAQLRTEQAARRRARHHWLRQQVLEEATLARVLVDLAEREAGVSLQLISGSVRRGRVLVVGADFVCVAQAGRSLAFVSLLAVASVFAEPGAPVVAGDRDGTEAESPVRFVDVLAALAAEREQVTLTVRGTSGRLTGAVQFVGQDVAALQHDVGGERVTSYVSTAAVVDVVVG